MHNNAFRFIGRAGMSVYVKQKAFRDTQTKEASGRVMIEVLIVLVGLVAGSLLVVQGCVMRQCFLAGQPRENAHFNNQLLTQ